MSVRISQLNLINLTNDDTLINLFEDIKEIRNRLIDNLNRGFVDNKPKKCKHDGELTLITKGKSSSDYRCEICGVIFNKSDIM